MKVVIVCLNQKFVAGTGKALGANLGLTQADLATSISTSFAKLKAPLFDFTKQWLDKKEREAVNKSCKNEIVTADYNHFSRYRAQMKGEIIYLRLDKDKVDKIYKPRFATLDLRIKGFAKQEVDAQSVDEAVAEIEKIIGEER